MLYVATKFTRIGTASLVRFKETLSSSFFRFLFTEHYFRIKIRHLVAVLANTEEDYRLNANRQR